MLELESLDPEGGENVNTAATLVVDLVEAFEKVQLIVVWNWATWFQVPAKIVNSSLWILCAREKVKEWRFILGTSEHRYGQPTRIKVVGLVVEDCYAGCDDKSLRSLP